MSGDETSKGQRSPKLTLAQVLMSMTAYCTACNTTHDGYMPCPDETQSIAEKTGVPPLPRV